MAGCVPVVVVVGLAARFGLSGTVADLAGGVLYTVLIYVLAAWLRPGWRPTKVAAAALAFSVAIELLQLTSIPADLVNRFSAWRVVVGSSFAATDLLAYVVGAMLAAGADLAMRRTGRGAARTPPAPRSRLGPPPSSNLQALRVLLHPQSGQCAAPPRERRRPTAAPACDACRTLHLSTTIAGFRSRSAQSSSTHETSFFSRTAP